MQRREIQLLVKEGNRPVDGRRGQRVVEEMLEFCPRRKLMGGVEEPAFSGYF
jgi:hypothetical protein